MRIAADAQTTVQHQVYAFKRLEIAGSVKAGAAIQNVSATQTFKSVIPISTAQLIRARTADQAIVEVRADQSLNA